MIRRNSIFNVDLNLIFIVFIAITYDVPSEAIPNPGYQCTYHECKWSDYIKNIDWGFYLQNGRNITGCSLCMAECDRDSLCSSIECGTDQHLQDGTVITPYCSYWRNGKCEEADEFKLNPGNFIWTCKKKNTGILSSIRFEL